MVSSKIWILRSFNFWNP